MRRAYGWTTKGDVVDDEAAILRSAAADIIGGASVTSIVTRLNDDQVPTASGKTWSIVVLSRMLRNPRMTGRRATDDGTLVATDVTPILDVDTWDQVRAILTDDDRSKYARRARRKDITTGVFVCGVCGLTAHPRSDRRGPDALRPDCGHVHITLDIATRELTERILARITTPAWLSALGDAMDNGRGHYEQQVADAEHRMEVLARTFGAGDEDAAAFEAGVAAARRVRDRAVESLSVLEATSSLPSLTDVEVVKWWAARATVDDQRAVVSTMVERVEILPLKQVTDRDRLRIHWR